jgi:hypothetical protein
MPGLQMRTGLTGSVVPQLYGGGGATYVPAAGIPEGGTVSMAAYGPAGASASAGASVHAPGITAAVVSGLALATLIVIWWAAPR